jgi:hypothetical protein
MSGLKIGKYYGEDTNKKTYLISETLENGYSDITSIEMIVKASDFANKDFLFTKDFLNSYVSTIDINTISDREKHLLCQYSVLPYDDIVSFYDASKTSVLVDDVDNTLINSLKTRKESVMDLFNTTFSSSQLSSLSTDLSINNTITFDLSSVITTIDNAGYLSNENKITIKNILSGETQKGYSDDIYK